MTVRDVLSTYPCNEFSVEENQLHGLHVRVVQRIGKSVLSSSFGNISSK